MSNWLKVDFFQIYEVSDTTLRNLVKEHKKNECAIFLMDKCPQPALLYLCQLGGRLIKSNQFEVNVELYKKEYHKNIQLDSLKENCMEIHNFVMTHINSHFRDIYFDNFK